MQGTDPDPLFSNSDCSLDRAPSHGGQPGPEDLAALTGPPGRGSQSSSAGTADSGLRHRARGQRRSAASVPGAAPWWFERLPSAEKEQRTAVRQVQSASPAPLTQSTCAGCLDVGTAQSTTAPHGDALITLGTSRSSFQPPLLTGSSQRPPGAQEVMAPAPGLRRLSK